LRYEDGTDYVEIDLSPPHNTSDRTAGARGPRAEGLTSEEHRSMGKDPKTPKEAVIDPEERLDLLLVHLGRCVSREGSPAVSATSEGIRALLP
jgi:hypothetical protein